VDSVSALIGGAAHWRLHHPAGLGLFAGAHGNAGHFGGYFSYVVLALPASMAAIGFIRSRNAASPRGLSKWDISCKERNSFVTTSKLTTDPECRPRGNRWEVPPSDEPSNGLTRIFAAQRVRSAPDSPTSLQDQFARGLRA
jgi:hypothetical protein